MELFERRFGCGSRHSKRNHSPKRATSRHDSKRAHSPKRATSPIGVGVATFVSCTGAETGAGGVGTAGGGGGASGGPKGTARSRTERAGAEFGAAGRGSGADADADAETEAGAGAETESETEAEAETEAGRGAGDVAARRPIRGGRRQLLAGARHFPGARSRRGWGGCGGGCERAVGGGTRSRAPGGVGRRPAKVGGVGRGSFGRWGRTLGFVPSKCTCVLRECWSGIRSAFLVGYGIRGAGGESFSPSQRVGVVVIVVLSIVDCPLG